MRRCIIIVVIFLLAGALVNVAAAWGCAWFPPSLPGEGAFFELRRWLWDKTGSAERIEQPDWPRDVPPHWPQPRVRLHMRWLGFDQVQFIAFERTDEPPRVHFSICIEDAGWPCRSLTSEAWSGLRSDVLLPEQSRWLTGIPVATRRSPYVVDWRRLPIRPRWGFAVNTVFYAAVLWLLILGPFALRRFIRVRRGLCPACAYPRGESDLCSECGKALPHRVGA